MLDGDGEGERGAVRADARGVRATDFARSRGRRGVRERGARARRTRDGGEDGGGVFVEDERERRGVRDVRGSDGDDDAGGLEDVFKRRREDEGLERGARRVRD